MEWSTKSLEDPELGGNSMSANLLLDNCQVI
jgi:hypothetical protein